MIPHREKRKVKKLRDHCYYKRRANKWGGDRAFRYTDGKTPWVQKEPDYSSRVWPEAIYPADGPVFSRVNREGAVIILWLFVWEPNIAYIS